MIKKIIIPFLIFLVLFFLPLNVSFAQTGDPAGIKTGGINDVPAAVSGKPTLNEVAGSVGHNKIAINMMWTLIAGFLVMFMQAGFALVETGFTRVKNVVHTMAMNLIIYAVGMTGFWIMGYAIMYGGIGPLATLGGVNVLNHEAAISFLGKTFGLFGLKGFFLGGSSYDVAVYTMFLFQMVFMDTAATIPTGAMAERWKFLPFVIYGFFMSMIIYPLFGNWVWGGGWLSQLGVNFGLGHGAVDFAGSGVVHMVGGWTALAGAMVLGARIGKYNKDGSTNAIAAHNIPMAVLGTIILAFGWFGFNPGSTLAGTDLRIAVVAVNTMIASAAGALSAMFYIWFKTGKPDLAVSVNGFLAGLVAITAPCAFVNSQSSFMIGLAAGLITTLAAFFIERNMKVDDPVGAVAVHGVSGAWGILALGLFADGTYGDGWNGVKGTVRGLFYGDMHQFLAQVIDVAVCVGFVFALSYAFFKVLDFAIGMRVSPEAELAGLDITEMGAYGYPESGVPEYAPSLTKKRSAKRKSKSRKRIGIPIRPAYIPVED